MFPAEVTPVELTLRRTLQRSVILLNFTISIPVNRQFYFFYEFFQVR